MAARLKQMTIEGGRSSSALSCLRMNVDRSDVPLFALKFVECQNTAARFV